MVDKVKIFKYGVIVGQLILGVSGIVEPYTQFTHRKITAESINLLNQSPETTLLELNELNFNGLAQEMIQGADNEDIPDARGTTHFYILWLLFQILFS